MTQDGSPETFDELLTYIERHARTILVREVVNNQPGMYTLAELSAVQALHHAFRWIREAIIPARRITDGEMKREEAHAGPDGG